MGVIASDSIQLKSIKNVKDIATAASTKVDAVDTAMTDLNNYFWHDNQGAHVLSDTSSVSGNRFRTDIKGAGQTIVQIDGQGNETEMAKFAADGVRLGETESTRVEITSNATAFFGIDNNQIASIDNGSIASRVTTFEIFYGDNFTGDISGNVYSADMGTKTPSTSTIVTLDVIVGRENGVEDEEYIDTFTIGTGDIVTIPSTVCPLQVAYDGTTVFAATIGNVPDMDKIFYLYIELSYSVLVADAHFSFGLNANATGSMAFAEGNSTSASGYYSHAEGYNTTASSHYSHAEGNNTAASNSASHAEGSGTTASGANSHAEGRNTKAKGQNAHAEGTTTCAYCYNGHAEGNQCVAGGQHTYDSVYNCHAEGFKTVASGNVSHSEGDTTTASGTASHSQGYKTTASGNNSHAEGSQTIASGSTAHSEGWLTTASRNESHAEGYRTTASGYAAHAEGGWTTASGDYSHSGGHGTTAASTAQTAVGAYNIEDNGDEYLFIVGNGDSDNARDNAFTVAWDGELGIHGAPSFDNATTKEAWKTALDLANDPVDVTGSVSASSGSDATVCNTAQYGAGVYLVSAYASFPASSSGRRHIHLATTNTGSALDNWSQLTLAPSNAQPTVMNMTGIYKRTSTGRWYLRAYQNSGSAQTVSGGIRVLKLH